MTDWKDGDLARCEFPGEPLRFLHGSTGFVENIPEAPEYLLFHCLSEDGQLRGRGTIPKECLRPLAPDEAHWAGVKLAYDRRQEAEQRAFEERHRREQERQREVIGQIASELGVPVETVEKVVEKYRGR